MRKNNNRNMKHRNNGGGQRRFHNNGGNRSHNDGQNLQRQKHHATQQLGKYNDLARNAQINGDRVDVEFYLQHVDHYTRVLTDIAAIEAERFAHHREQQGQHQAEQGSAAEAPADADAEGGVSAAAEGAAAAETGAAVAGEAPAQPAAPRQGRGRGGQRRAYTPPASDNGAAEANSNTAEIPLPGSILPPI